MNHPVPNTAPGSTGLRPDGAAQVMPGDSSVGSVVEGRSSVSGSPLGLPSLPSCPSPSEPAGQPYSGAQGRPRPHPDDRPMSQHRVGSRGAAGASGTATSGPPPSLALPVGAGSPMQLGGSKPPGGQRRGAAAGTNQRPPRPNADARPHNVNKRRATQHEDFISRQLRGRRVPGSGALGEPGDVRVDGPLAMLVECKLSAERSFRLDLDAIEKLSAQADAEGLIPALALRVTSAKPGVEQDWIAVPLRIFIGLLRRAATADAAHAKSPPSARSRHLSTK